jgi:hypothetical protein
MMVLNMRAIMLMERNRVRESIPGQTLRSMMATGTTIKSADTESKLAMNFE